MEGAKVVILGAGSVGSAATNIGVGMGAQVRIMSLDLDQLFRLHERYQGRVVTLATTKGGVDRAVEEAGLVVGAVMVRGAFLVLLGCIMAAPASSGEARQPGDTFRDCAACPEMVVLPAGAFVMGTDGRHKYERPAHPVTLGLTDTGLSNWNDSQHNYFTATAGLTVLATNPALQANVLVGSFGAGRLVYFGIDPSFHQPAGQSRQLILQAVRWAGGFAGAIWPVNPANTEIEGLPCYDSVAALPEAPDLSFIAVPGSATVEVVRELANRGAGGAVCYAAGFAEVGREGAELQRRRFSATRPVWYCWWASRLVATKA